MVIPENTGGGAGSEQEKGRKGANEGFIVTVALDTAVCIVLWPTGQLWGIGFSH